MGNTELKIAARVEQTRQTAARKSLLHSVPVVPNLQDILKEETFRVMLTLERRRAQRSRNPFVLMLVDSHAVHANGQSAVFMEQLTSAVSEAVRESDLIGWYEAGTVLGVIFTEISHEGHSPIIKVLETKVAKMLREHLDPKFLSKLVITFHVYPERWDEDNPNRTADVKLYPDVSETHSKKRIPTIVKRCIDIVGSGLLLLISAPFLAAIAVAIKLTSKGPVIFKQDRLGQFGKRFQCLKFRTMTVDNDPKIHREYVQKLIAGKPENESKQDGEPGVYKIKNDPRVTRIGKFLRKTSLDEFPQFWNVLRGEMSLVGPRPPVPYEFEVYDFWHRRRVLEVKPGVTGLWQVSGRSRTCFDDMVRLDLRYSQKWSIWLDLRILLATPRAVFTGDGAF